MHTGHLSRGGVEMDGSTTRRTAPAVTALVAVSVVAVVLLGI